mgnify:CR=1 FL=1
MIFLRHWCLVLTAVLICLGLSPAYGQSDATVVNLKVDPEQPRTGDTIKIWFNLGQGAARAQVKWSVNGEEVQLADYIELSKCSEGTLWIESCKDEFGRLCQGHGAHMPSGTNTMFFIPVTSIPKGKKPTYLHIVAALRPEKPNPH